MGPFRLQCADFVCDRWNVQPLAKIRVLTRKDGRNLRLPFTLYLQFTRLVCSCYVFRALRTAFNYIKDLVLMMLRR